MPFDTLATSPWATHQSSDQSALWSHIPSSLLVQKLSRMPRFLSSLGRLERPRSFNIGIRIPLVFSPKIMLLSLWTKYPRPAQSPSKQFITPKTSRFPTPISMFLVYWVTVNQAFRWRTFRVWRLRYRGNPIKQGYKEELADEKQFQSTFVALAVRKNNWIVLIWLRHPTITMLLYNRWMGQGIKCWRVRQGSLQRKVHSFPWALASLHIWGTIMQKHRRKKQDCLAVQCWIVMVVFSKSLDPRLASVINIKRSITYFARYDKSRAWDSH